MQVHKPHVHHDVSATAAPSIEAHARHVDWLFEPVYHEIERRLDEPNVDKPELYETAHRLEAEVLKGIEASPEKVRRWLRMYQEVAPDILVLATAALQKPDAGISSQIREVVDLFVLQPVH